MLHEWSERIGSNVPAHAMSYSLRGCPLSHNRTLQQAHPMTNEVIKGLDWRGGWRVTTRHISLVLTQKDFARRFTRKKSSLNGRQWDPELEMVHQEFNFSIIQNNQNEKREYIIEFFESGIMNIRRFPNGSLKRQQMNILRIDSQ
jgi:hypothetical protein